MTRLADPWIDTGIPVALAAQAAFADYVDRGHLTIWQILVVPAGWVVWQVARWAEQSWRQ
jgi:hypothetical protein